MAKKASKKSSPKPATKPTSAPAPKTASAKPKAGNPRGKKLGERTETIVERLSLTQVEAERETACNLMRAKTDLEEKKKASGAEFGARIKEVDQKMKAALAAAASGRRDVEITVEEWLTPTNQVQRYRTDTGELIGDRQARAADLQEDLPFEPSSDSESDTTEADAAAIEETASDSAAAGDPTDGDFGEE